MTTSHAYKATCRRAGRRGAITRRGNYAPLPYEVKLLRQHYASAGPKGMLGMLSRSESWIRHVASTLELKYEGVRERPKPGTDDPVAVARMDQFIRRGRV